MNNHHNPPNDYDEEEDRDRLMLEREQFLLQQLFRMGDNDMDMNMNIENDNHNQGDALFRSRFENDHLEENHHNNDNNAAADAADAADVPPSVLLRALRRGDATMLNLWLGSSTSSSNRNSISNSSNPLLSHRCHHYSASEKSPELHISDFQFEKDASYVLQQLRRRGNHVTTLLLSSPKLGTQDHDYNNNINDRLQIPNEWKDFFTTLITSLKCIRLRDCHADSYTFLQTFFQVAAAPSVHSTTTAATTTTTNNSRLEELHLEHITRVPEHALQQLIDQTSSSIQKWVFNDCTNTIPPAIVARTLRNPAIQIVEWDIPTSSYWTTTKQQHNRKPTLTWEWNRYINKMELNSNNTTLSQTWCAALFDNYDTTSTHIESMTCDLFHSSERSSSNLTTNNTNANIMDPRITFIAKNPHLKTLNTSMRCHAILTKHLFCTLVQYATKLKHLDFSCNEYHMEAIRPMAILTTRLQHFVTMKGSREVNPIKLKVNNGIFERLEFWCNTTHDTLFATAIHIFFQISLPKHFTINCRRCHHDGQVPMVVAKSLQQTLLSSSLLTSARTTSDRQKMETIEIHDAEFKLAAEYNQNMAAVTATTTDTTETTLECILNSLVNTTTLTLHNVQIRTGALVQLFEERLPRTNVKCLKIKGFTRVAHRSVSEMVRNILLVSSSSFNSNLKSVDLGQLDYATETADLHLLAKPLQQPETTLKTLVLNAVDDTNTNTNTTTNTTCGSNRMIPSTSTGRATVREICQLLPLLCNLETLVLHFTESSERRHGNPATTTAFGPRAWEVLGQAMKQNWSLQSLQVIVHPHHNSYCNLQHQQQQQRPEEPLEVPRNIVLYGQRNTFFQRQALVVGPVAAVDDDGDDALTTTTTTKTNKTTTTTNTTTTTSMSLLLPNALKQALNFQSNFASTAIFQSLVETADCWGNAKSLKRSTVMQSK